MSRFRETPGARLKDNGGFTLVEVLVALVVLATILSVLFRGVVGVRLGANTADGRKHADLVAAAIFEEALAKRDLRDGTTSGTRQGRRWTLTATSVDLSAQLPPPDPDIVAESDGNQNNGPQNGAQPPPGGGAQVGMPGPGPQAQTQAQAGGPAPGPNTDPTQATQNNPPQKPAWAFQRLVVDVDTGGRPVEIETIRLVKAPQ